MQACLLYILYIEINCDIKEIEIKRNTKILDFLSEENWFDQRSCNFQKLPFSLLKFSDKNNILTDGVIDFS